MRYSIRSKGETSIWYKFLHAIFRFFGNELYGIINYIYDQIFLEHADYDTLKKAGSEYGIYPKPGEMIESFRLRVRTYRSLLRLLLSVSLCKQIFRIYLDVEAEIFQGTDFNVFTIGVTPLGEGVCLHSTYWKWTWKATLPDLSAETVDREEVMEMLENFNIASNEIIVVEDRPGGEWAW